MNISNLDQLDLLNVEKILNQYADVVINKYKERLIVDNKLCSGKLINSVKSEINLKHETYTVTLKFADYWWYVEHGRKSVKEKPSQKQPPIYAMIDFVRNKPVIPHADKNGKLPTEKQLAFLIGRAIKENGIKPGKQLEETLEECNARYLVMLQEALNKDIDLYLVKIKNEIDSTIKLMFN